MGLPSWPSITDDSGDGLSGTEVNKAWADAVKASVEAVVESATNPTVTPADIIDEVVTARGSKSDLDTRLDVSIHDDGTLKTLSGYPTTAEVQAHMAGAKNFFPDSLLTLWPDGDASAPYNWTLSGTGATIARAGSGLGDSTQMPYGRWCAKITYGSATAKLTRQLLSATQVGRASGLEGLKVCFGCFGKSSIANHLSIVVDDGIATTQGGESGNGTYHTGSGSAEWLYVEHEISSGATKLDFYVQVHQAGSAYASCFVGIKGDLPPSDWFPERWGYITMVLNQRDDLVVDASNPIGELRMDQLFANGAIMVSTNLRVKTAPVGADINVTPKKNAADAPYSTQPAVADGANRGDGAPDGTYANRCFKQYDYLTAYITQIGSGTAGGDLTAEFVFVTPINELDLLSFG